MTGSLIESLSQEAKIWAARAIAGVIVADNVIRQEELKVLKEAISFLDDGYIVNQIVEQIKTRSLAILENLKTDRETAVNIIMVLAHTAAVDTDLAKQEVEYIVQAGQKIGLSKRYTNRVIKWHQEYARIEAEKSQLIADGHKSRAKYD